MTFDERGNPCRTPTRGEAVREWGHILSLPLFGVLVLLGVWAIRESLSDHSSSLNPAVVDDTGGASLPDSLTTPAPDTWAADPSETRVVLVQLLPTATAPPTPRSTHVPLVVALTVVAEHWTPTPDITACPMDPSTLPAGVMCEWPDPPPPTPTPYPRCQTPIPGAVCQPRGSWVPPAQTPTPTPRRGPGT